ncbi:uncharacterized protein LOC132900205 [Neoarius graeffei]|uniref:uncharacterized protein LOC132900205 n=1 Tax=Neoarius graeffei TaxID=443677 RepID=UPI00298BCD2B|nr:uncharacterized protein LOC132900205 [Neoarius graeffei]
MTVAEVLVLGPRQRISVSRVDVKIVQALGCRIVPLNSVPTEVKAFAVCDPTGQTSLSVWGAQVVSVQEGRSYRFDALDTRKQGDLTVLTTTPSSAVSVIAEVGQPSTMEPLSPGVKQTVRGEVTGVQIVANPQCRRCHASQDGLATRSTTHRCERCKILQRTNAYTFTYAGVLIVMGDDGMELSGTLTNSAVFNYVRDNFLSASAHDSPVLEEHVIGQGELEVTTNGEGLVLGFVSARSAEPVQSPAAQGDQAELSFEELFGHDKDTEG